MDKKEFLKNLSVLFLISILFTYQESKESTFFLLAGLIFGIVWFFWKQR